MNTSWEWPGSRWWRTDLHAHSPASLDFGGETDRTNPDWQRWVSAVADTDIEAVAVTDHNTAEAVDHLREAIANVDKGPVLFPGVEITASDGTHLLFLADPGCTRSHVDDFLSRIQIPVDQRGRDTARSPFSVEQILDECNDDALIVGPHVNRPKGLLQQNGQGLIAVLRHPRLSAVEVVPDDEAVSDWLDGSHPEVDRTLSQLWSSDGHSYCQLGRRFTWVKMTRPTLEGLRLAFLDGAGSLRPATSEDPGDPNNHAALAIERITVRNAKFMGHIEPMNVAFNPWLNAIIGGRGTGKSTLIDLCRKTLRRDEELDSSKATEGSLRQTFNRRMRVALRGDEGLLTPDTQVELVYRKEGERFLLSWSCDGQAPPIALLGDAEPVVEEGNIRERFPVRIYSQKQLFELAQDPNALLSVIDDSTTVRRAELDRALERIEARYLSLRAEARAALKQAHDLPNRRASLGDIRRKIEHLQQGGHARVLQEFRLRRQQDDTWEAILQSALHAVERVDQAADDLSVADLGFSLDVDSDPAQESLGRVHQNLTSTVASLRQQVRTAVQVARKSVAEIRAGESLGSWRTAVAASEAAFQDASSQLREEGISDPNEYTQLLKKSADLEQEILDLQAEGERARKLDAEAGEELKRYRELRAELTERRRNFTVETSGETIRVEVDPYRGQDDLPATLAEILNIGAFADDRKALAERIGPAEDGTWQWERLDGVVEKLARLVVQQSNDWSAKDGRFLSALRKIPPERLDRLALYLPEDGLEVRFREDRGRPWKPLAQGSPGQQTAALLAFVLGYGSEPILLDQPEDDLDNTLVYKLLVQRLRETKIKRQVIVVTHNPNIVVHGDAEFVLSLESHHGQSRIVCSGGLQEQAVRDEICSVMEGGSEAFESRYRRIMPASRARP